MPAAKVRRTGQGGRRSAPQELKELRGVQPSRQNRQAPKYVAASPDPPELLREDEDALAVWWRVVPELLKFQLLTTVEVDALTAYCLAVSRHHEACRDVAENGITIIGSMGGVIKNPAVTVQFEAARAIRTFAVEFGLTPAARMNVAGPVDRSAQTADDFFTELETGS